MRAPVYLDYNATAPIRPEAARATAEALMLGANPSSVHAQGRKARAVVEQARETVARFAGAPAGNVVFTSGGTEANALGLTSAAAAGFAPFVISAIEHEAVVETARAAGPVEIAPVGADGTVDLEALASRLKALNGARPIVAIMLANNETGVIQPVAEASALVRGAGGWLHVDAIQAAGRMPLDLEELGADSLVLSAHKLGGPHGVGALMFGPRATLTRQLHGGGQERGRRAGTENVAGIAGFAAAIEASAADRPEDQTAWRDAAASRLSAQGATVLGAHAPRLANTLCVAVEDWPSALQVIALDLDGVMVSAGSACSSGKVKPSRVVEAMGLDALAAGALRASGGWATREADWLRFADVWIEACRRYRSGRENPAARSHAKSAA